MKFPNLSLVLLSLSSLTLSSLSFATPLESLHQKTRWLTHAGTIEIKTYDNYDHHLLETTICKGLMHTAYELPPEADTESAFFSMESSGCVAKADSTPSWLNRREFRSYEGITLENLDIDLSSLKDAGGTYEDTAMEKSTITSTLDSVKKWGRVPDGTLMSIDEVSKVTNAKTQKAEIQFVYREIISSGKHVGQDSLRAIGTFSMDAYVEPSDDALQSNADH
jgi:hypothetical protein